MLRLAPRPTPVGRARFAHPVPTVLDEAGLRVVATDVPGDGVVDVRLLWSTGYVNESAVGVGELVARTLGTCTAVRDPYHYACAVEELGASVAADVTAEATVLRVDAVHDRTPAALDLALESLILPDLAASDRLRVEAIDARRRALADPRTCGRETLFARVHAGTPYARARSASTAALEAVTSEDLDRHLQRLTASAPTLVVTGNLRRTDPTTLARSVADRLGLVHALYAPPPAEGDARLAPESAAQEADLRHVSIVHRPGAVQSTVHLGHGGPPRAHRQHANLLLGTSLLGGGFTSRLNLRLREDLGITYGARAHVIAQRGAGALLLEAAVERDATWAAVDETFAVVRRLLGEGIRADELADTRTWLLGRTPQRYQTVGMTADAVAGALALGVAPDELGTLDDEIAVACEDDVVEALRTHLRPDALGLVVVGDADHLRNHPWERYGPVTVIDAPTA